MCRAVIPVDRDRLLKQSQSLKNPIFCYGIEGSKGAEIEIVGVKIGGRASGGTAHLRGLQCRLDDAPAALRHLLPGVENRLPPRIPAVGPEMRPTCRLDH